MTKTDPFDKLQSFLPFSFSFTLEAHYQIGGDIKARNMKAGGAEFTIKLPIRKKK